jgi:hypothetical protein
VSSGPLSQRMNAGWVVEDGHGGVRVDRGLDKIAEGLPCELVGDVQDLDGPPGGDDVELLVECPDMVGVGGDQAVGRRGRCPPGASCGAWEAPGGPRCAGPSSSCAGGGPPEVTRHVPVDSPTVDGACERAKLGSGSTFSGR